MGCESITGLPPMTPPSLNSIKFTSSHLHTRQSESKVFCPRTNTTKCPWPGLEQGHLIWSRVNWLWGLHTSHLVYTWGEKFFLLRHHLFVCLLEVPWRCIYIRCLGRRGKDDILGGWGGNSTRDFQKSLGTKHGGRGGGVTVLNECLLS